MEGHKNTALYFVATVAFISMVAVNALANLLPINGLNTGEVSDLYPSLFTPSAITFSIWSLIYGLLIGFIIIAWNKRNDLIMTKVLLYFTVSCILNLSWIILWHYRLPAVSVVIMLALLAILIVIFKTMQNEKSHDLKIKVWLILPMTIYLAWICVATIANIAALLVSLDWRGGVISEQSWTLIMMSIATLLALKITSKFDVPSFSVVVIWAVFGIFLRWRESDYAFIIYGSIFLMSIMIINLIYVIRKKTVKTSH